MRSTPPAAPTKAAESSTRQRATLAWGERVLVVTATSIKDSAVGRAAADASVAVAVRAAAESTRGQQTTLGARRFTGRPGRFRCSARPTASGCGDHQSVLAVAAGTDIRSPHALIKQQAMTVLALAGGSWIFLGVVVMLFFVLVFSYFTVAGSGINLHPWEDQDGSSHGADGSGNAAGRDEASDVRNWTRGTR